MIICCESIEIDLRPNCLLDRCITSSILGRPVLVLIFDNFFTVNELI